MADMTLCTNEKCTKRRKCYRATAPWGELQSVAQFTPSDNGRCDFYIDAGNIVNVEKHEEEPQRTEW